MTELLIGLFIASLIPKIIRRIENANEEKID